MAIRAALAARKSWAALDWEERLSIFMKAAALLAGPWRDTLNAATMLGQSKNVFQAEIDAAEELTDFFRFNAYYAMRLFEMQPPHSPMDVRNKMEYRPLEGFIFAVSPFNFTSISRKPADGTCHGRQRGAREAGVERGLFGVLHYEDA